MQDTIQDAIDREDDDDDNEDQVSCLVDFIQSRNNTDAFADCASSLRGVNEGDDIRSCPVGCDDAFAEVSRSPTPNRTINPYTLQRHQGVHDHCRCASVGLKTSLVHLQPTH